jgi:TPR repeat protein
MNTRTLLTFCSEMRLLRLAFCGLLAAGLALGHASAQTRPAPSAPSAAATAAPVGVPSTAFTRGLPGQPNDNVQSGVAALQRGHYAIAMRAWRGDADKGNALAQSNVGYLHEHGLGVSQSYPEAMAWYRKAAAQNLPQAQFNIGTLYFYGYGVERNPREGLKWFRQAAKANLAEAQYMLGLAYYEGTGVPPDAIQALDWFVKSALLGYPAAQLMSGMVYLSGDAGRIEADKAYVWAEVAYTNGVLDASLLRDYASYKISRKQIEQAKAAGQQCIQSAYANCPVR